ncbi:hypothetical protein Sjap_010877 [Stephania japonica]|uniref:non-specific serine/threonine protein kinase n=1 Tax=Stephania japonica TaxID=461633 RepID=A0AAP0P6W4_9MAGN
MASALLSSILILALFVRLSNSEQPNTDGFFISDFFKKMGVIDSDFFNFSAPVCSWQGVFCDAQRQNVIGLEASGLSLFGVIPETTMGKLSKLQSLDLSNNQITNLPSDFWGLGSSLKSLNLSHNQISGPLTNNIGNFEVLEVLDLSFNNFSSELPESFSSLLSLQVLELSHNQFVGSIPPGIMKCQSLVLIDMSYNQLNGTIPPDFGSAFPKLTTLNLAGNNIHGRSSVFSGMKSISYLNVSGNSFHGSIMSVFQKRMEVIDLSRNYFQGQISEVYLNSSFNISLLVFLDISMNQLSGEFFHDWNEAQNLKHLNLAANRFSGQEFPILEKLSSLEYLNLSAAGLIGRIPGEISKLASLNTLDLSNNDLSGEIPSISTSNLQVLELSVNDLTGEVPSSLLDYLPHMKMYNFSYNNLTFCATELPPEIFTSAFVGSANSCPIAANPDLFRRKSASHNVLKLSLAVTLSTVSFFLGLVCLALGCRNRTKMWAAKETSSKEEKNISGPFSFQTDSSTWIADVKLANSVPVVIFEKPLSSITFADLLSATLHFDRSTLIAEGRFGPVYKGFLPGEIHVAVKVLAHVSTLTDKEVATQLEQLGRIKHPNLVPMIGYCLAGDQRIAIYEYMENGNLQKLLHDQPLGIERPTNWSPNPWEEQNDTATNQDVFSEGLLATWRFRHKIALGIARALAFLHHGCSPSIVHRDVKASSVYIDSNLETRLSDFGLVSSLEDDITNPSRGYVPPENYEPENAASSTLKSDVYGFGVVLFELITGKKPVGDYYPDGNESNETNLVAWVRGLVRKNKGGMAIDLRIRGTGILSEMVEGLRIGYLCTADLPEKRPCMQQIVGLLKDIEPVHHN